MAEGADPSLDESRLEAFETTLALRAAICQTNMMQTQKLRWQGPRKPSERDLFGDLVDAEGMWSAIKKLARFWSNAEAHLEHVRVIGEREAEVYERMRIADATLPIVTFLRRDHAKAPWRVVCTGEAHDGRFRVWVTAIEPLVDELAWNRVHFERGRRGELLLDGGEGVLSHPVEGWLLSLSSSFVLRDWPEELTGQGMRVLELTSALCPEPEERVTQLNWILRSSQTLLEVGGGVSVYLPDLPRAVLPRALARIAEQRATDEQRFRFWVHRRLGEGYLHTEGLSRLALPELEASLISDAISVDPHQASKWLACAGAALLSGQVLVPGQVLLCGDDRVAVSEGRRGPRRGSSYGRFGALALTPSDA